MNVYDLFPVALSVLTVVIVLYLLWSDAND